MFVSDFTNYSLGNVIIKQVSEFLFNSCLSPCGTAVRCLYSVVNKHTCQNQTRTISRDKNKKNETENMHE